MQLTINGVGAGLFTIERDVEPPNSGAGKKLYHWELMQPGDSVLIETPRIGSVRASITHYKTKHDGLEFRTRTEGPNMVRVWRLA